MRQQDQTLKMEIILQDSLMHKQFLKRAIKLAEINSRDGKNGPFGAILAKDGEIIGEGWNQVVELRDPSAHAEIMAIRQACAHLDSYSLSGCILYSSCEPCPMCLATIYWAEIDRLFYACTTEDAEKAGFKDSLVYHQLSLDWNERSITSTQDCRDEGQLILKKWISNPQKMTY